MILITKGGDAIPFVDLVIVENTHEVSWSIESGGRYVITLGTRDFAVVLVKRIVEEFKNTNSVDVSPIYYEVLDERTYGKRLRNKENHHGS